MDRERIIADLARESEDIITGMRDWRTAHPTATFAEIEATVDARLDGLRARLLGELAVASAAAGGAAGSTAARPVCPACGTRLAPRGTRTRELTVQGNQPVRLTRGYWACPACGAGLFPP
ncbi:MAG TPA: hypothetical protein VMU89_11825 [Thermomicrobiaceae bacterium]|nr:hypothetical protein [Thermomicrobiaceae bacterium]